VLRGNELIIRRAPAFEVERRLELPPDRHAMDTRGGWRCLLSTDQRRLVALEMYKWVVVCWDMQTGNLFVNYSLPEMTGSQRNTRRANGDRDGLSVSRTGDFLLDRRLRGFAVLRSVETGAALREFGTEEDWLTGIEFTPDGSAVVASYANGRLEAINVEDRTQRFQLTLDSVEIEEGEPDRHQWFISTREGGEWGARSASDGTQIALSRGVGILALPDRRMVTSDGLLDVTGEVLDPRWRIRGGCPVVPSAFAVVASQAQPESIISGNATTLTALPWAEFETSPSDSWAIATHFDTWHRTLQSGRLAHGSDVPSGGPILAIGIDSSGRDLLTVDASALLTFDPMRIDRFPVSGVIANVLLGAASANGERLVAINQDSLQIIDADGLHERLRVDHPGATTRAVALNATGELLALLDASGELSVRSALDNTVLARGSVSAEFTSASPRCAIGSEGSIAVANGRGDVAVFTRANSQLTERTRTSVSGGAVTAIVAVPARKEFLVGMKDGSTHVVDEATLAVRVTLPTNGHAIGAMTPSFDGLRYFTASDDGSIRIWHSETGKELLTLNEERITAAPTAIFIEANNERLVVGYANGAERVWDAVTWAERVRRRGKPEWPNTEPKLVPVGAPDNR
jgi:WD40 repeat protein